jgi:Raf kinase inhibitor-like YbhB/YbcL family protein
MPRITSRAFADGADIPRQYTADGENISPPLSWGEPPAGTESFALICEDPDAPSGLFVHWTAWNIEPDRRELEEGLPATPESGIRQGVNSFGDLGYGGPSPPRGVPHRYVFRLYALDSRLDLRSGATRAELDRAIEGHVLEESLLIGRYGRTS